MAEQAARIAEIEKRLADITPGLWAVRERGYGWCVDAPQHVVCALSWTKFKREEANTRFIAAAPEDIAFLLKIAKGGAEDGWVAVTPETMPGFGPVLLCDEGVVEQGYLYEGKWFLSRTDGQDDAIEVYPTHWMPLLAPPAVEEGRK